MNKKRFLLFIPFLLMLAFSGCSNNAGKENISFAYGGVTVSIGDKMKEVQSKFPKNFFKTTTGATENEIIYWLQPQDSPKSLALVFSANTEALIYISTDSNKTKCPNDICVGDNVQKLYDIWGEEAISRLGDSPIYFIGLDKQGNIRPSPDSEFYAFIYEASAETGEITNVSLSLKR